MVRVLVPRKFNSLQCMPDQHNRTSQEQVAVGCRQPRQGDEMHQVSCVGGSGAKRPWEPLLASEYDYTCDPRIRGCASSYSFASSHLACLLILTLSPLAPRSALFQTRHAAFHSFLHQCHMTRNMETLDAFPYCVNEAPQHDDLVISCETLEVPFQQLCVV